MPLQEQIRRKTMKERRRTGDILCVTGLATALTPRWIPLALSSRRQAAADQPRDRHRIPCRHHVSQRARHRLSLLRQNLLRSTQCLLLRRTAQLRHTLIRVKGGQALLWDPVRRRTNQVWLMLVLHLLWFLRPSALSHGYNKV